MGKEIVTDTHSLYIQDIQKYETNQTISAKRYILFVGSFKSDYKDLFKILSSFDQVTKMIYLIQALFSWRCFVKDIDQIIKILSDKQVKVDYYEETTIKR